MHEPGRTNPLRARLAVVLLQPAFCRGITNATHQKRRLSKSDSVHLQPFSSTHTQTPQRGSCLHAEQQAAVSSGSITSCLMSLYLWSTPCCTTQDTLEWRGLTSTWRCSSDNSAATVVAAMTRMKALDHIVGPQIGKLSF